MPLTVKIQDGKVVLDGTIDDPVMVATIQQIQVEHGLASWEDALRLCLVTGARYMRFLDHPIPDGQRRLT